MSSVGKFESRHQFKKRRENIRQERVSEIGEVRLLLFSLKDFDQSQIPPGQSYEEWQNSKLLSYMLEELCSVCQWTVPEALQSGKLAIYKNFPPKSKFVHPRHIAKDVQWAVLKDIKGQKARVIGHIIDNVFYIVFLDKDHVFWKTEKKHT